MSQATTWSVPLAPPALVDDMAQRMDESYDALLSAHSGTSRPSYAVAGTVWMSTATAGKHIYYQYDGTNDIQLFSVDTAGNYASFSDINPRADVASASTTNIGAAVTRYVNITGTTTITAFDTVAAGTWRNIRFNAALTLTHNGTSLILPNNGSNITTAAGDQCVAVSMGSGNWAVVNYQRLDGQALATSSHQGVAKAWVNFNGTGTVAIRDSYNVSSITDGGTGTYTVNFATAMPSANYATLVSATGISLLSGTYTASAVGVATRDGSFVLADASFVSVAVFGD